ncbi:MULTISPECIES: ROK family protein [unclassified Streptomyces]|uniref:ROK family protein n=1 Tax=unclassified Streptomyces TaxID=2593676 RepID=UPI00094026D7|nr:ROK family protein [Streptomyces sp. CB02058]OKI88716.1 hypothetical protein AMK10_30810 [Streptomyces sp. CB02058]
MRSSSSPGGSVVGIDLGGTDIRAALVSPDGAVVHSIRRSTHRERGPHAVVEEEADHASVCLEAGPPVTARERADLKAVYGGCSDAPVRSSSRAACLPACPRTPGPRLVTPARRQNVSAVVCATGNALLASLDASPAVVEPNRSEQPSPEPSAPRGERTRRPSILATVSQRDAR